jgi:hypothetical protein
MRHFGTCLLLFALVVSCGREAVDSGPPVHPKSADGFDHDYKCRSVADLSREMVWPVPSDASTTPTGVHTKVIAPGYGRRPDVRSGETVVLCTTRYGTDGRVIEHNPLLVYDLDVPPKEWQEIVSQMHEGEIRRFWTSPRGHLKDFAIVDFELQPIPIQPQTPPSK